jgi:N utilization substance protein B
MFPSEDLAGHLEEHFLHWDDDAEMMQQMLMNFLHKPASYNFRQIVSQEKRTFAMNLLTTAIEKKDYCLELIKPRLKNWDADRIAQLDMIIMRLGVCELLYFETIPAKVTINEYIDLAKEYSTPQSGQFVNGLLDNIHKEIEQQGNLNKVDYKK